MAATLIPAVPIPLGKPEAETVLHHCLQSFQEFDSARLEQTTQADAALTNSRPKRRTHPQAGRWVFGFAIIGVLVGMFGFIAFWGFTHSDWLYGTYGQISQDQWDHIAEIRIGLVELDLGPDAVAFLDDALLLPHPSTEDVLYDLRRANLALDPFAGNGVIHRIQDRLQALIAAIQSGSRSLWEREPRE